MKGKYKSLINDILIFGLGSFGSKIILFLLVPLYTNVLSTDEYGIADLVFTIAQFLIPFVSLVIFDGVIRFALSKNEAKENVLLNGFIVLGFAAFITFLITPLIGLYKPISQWKWHLYIYVILNIWNSIQLNYLKSKDKNKLFAIISIIQTATMAGLNVLLLVVFKRGVSGYLLSYIISNFTAVVLTFILGNIASDLKKSHFNIKLLKQMVIYSTPLILNNVSWWVIHSSDKIMIEHMLTTTALGLYTVSAKIPSLINVFVSIFSQAWGISSVKEIESTNDISFYSKIFKSYYLFACFICLVLVGIMKLFMNFYVGEEFRSAWVYVPLLLVSAVFSSVSSYYGSLYGALKKSVNNMVTTLLAALSNLFFNFLLIPLVGVWGAVIGTVVSYIVIALSRIIDVQKYIKLDIDWFHFSINALIIIICGIVVSFDFYPLIVSILFVVVFILFNRVDLMEIVTKLYHKGAKNEKN